MSEQFVSLGETQLGVDRIATSPTAYAFYENVPAMARGAPGAPRISPWALVTEINTGTTVVYQRAEPITHASNQWVRRVDERLLNFGSLQFIYDFRRTSGSGKVFTEIYRIRGTTETQFGSTFSAGPGPLVNVTQNITGIEVGDRVVLRTRCQNSDGVMEVVDFRMRTSGTLLTPYPLHFVIGSAPE